MALTETAPLSRKARRKQERQARKRKHVPPAPSVVEKPVVVQEPSPTKKSKKKRPSPKAFITEQREDPLEADNTSRKRSKGGDFYDSYDTATVAALRRDDEEIAALEAKLGLGNAKSKSRLHREYSSEEGFGDDFGEFLEGLDSLSRRIATGSEDYAEEELEEEYGQEMGPSVSDDDESSLESPYQSDADDLNEDDESADEEEVPMKDPAYSDDSPYDPDNVLEENEEHQEDEEESETEYEVDASENGLKERTLKSEDNDDEAEDGSEEEVSDEEADNSDNSEEEGQEPDHAVQHTYRPNKGEDIYGKSKDSSKPASSSKYVPPHLRKKQEPTNDRQESLRVIERLLNNSLNRLSEDTILSVAQTIAKLYDDHAKSDVNESIWKLIRNTCVERSFIMTGLTPVYTAALVGIHHMRSSAQLVENLLEQATTDLVSELEQQAEAAGGENTDPELISKKACNLALVLCYLYNYGVVHCSLLYDLIRRLIASFHEVDVEVLLIFLSHCGRSLRSDDPLALKEIVLEVQKRAVAVSSTSSRIDYMLSAMMDLKNNKRRKQDQGWSDKATKLRKSIGQIKSKVATSNGKASDNSLRITLKDILEAETRGRWWRVGASWSGNQFHDEDRKNDEPDEDSTKIKPSASIGEDDRLLKLASKYRMNSDIRRSVFCIIMGAADCEDAFEKIVRAGVLKNKNERDTVRVLMECCGNEKTYNKFYEHLASRICEYQGRCRFTFQLAFWDIFKQFDDMKLRKSANLAKLLFALTTKHRVLKLNVLKAIDMASPEDLPETATIFLTIFFSNVMEYFEDESGVSELFASGIHQGKQQSEDEMGEDALGHADEADALRASLTLFFIQVLKSSPKYKKGSKFRVNLKAAIKACDTDNFF